MKRDKSRSLPIGIGDIPLSKTKVKTPKVFVVTSRKALTEIYKKKEQMKIK